MPHEIAHTGVLVQAQVVAAIIQPRGQREGSRGQKRTLSVGIEGRITPLVERADIVVRWQHAEAHLIIGGGQQIGEAVDAAVIGIRVIERHAIQEQLDPHTSHADRLARVLQTVGVRIKPDQIADGGWREEANIPGWIVRP